MTKSTLPPLLIDIDPLLRKWGLPYWTWARLRQLRVGEGRHLASFEAPCFGEVNGSVGVDIVREKGGIFRIEAGWVAHLGKNAQRRGHLLSWVDFKMRPGRQIELFQPNFMPDGDVRLQALRLVTIVMRRAVLLARWAKLDGDRAAYNAMAPEHCFFGGGSDDGALDWLEKLRGPELHNRFGP